MVYTLFLWTVVGFAGAGTQFSSSFKTDFKTEMDWRPMAETVSKAECERVAKELALKENKYRCVKTK